jgi:hypothetical protein
VFVGDSKVCMLAMVSPTLGNGSESMCTLGFAERAAAINLRTVKAPTVAADAVHRLRVRCRALDSEVDELRCQLSLAVQGATACQRAGGSKEARGAGTAGADSAATVAGAAADREEVKVEVEVEEEGGPGAPAPKPCLPPDARALVSAIKRMAQGSVNASVADCRVYAGSGKGHPSGGVGRKENTGAGAGAGTTAGAGGGAGAGSGSGAGLGPGVGHSRSHSTEPGKEGGREGHGAGGSGPALSAHRRRGSVGGTAYGWADTSISSQGPPVL